MQTFGSVGPIIAVGAYLCGWPKFVGIAAVGIVGVGTAAVGTVVASHYYNVARLHRIIVLT